MKGEGLAGQVLSSIKTGDYKRVIRFFNGGLAAAEHHIRTGDFVIMSPAEEDIASSIMYGQENMDQLMETLQFAKELLVEKLGQKELNAYAKLVNEWLLKNKPVIDTILNAGFRKSVDLRL